jgi:hypothetical protein
VAGVLFDETQTTLVECPGGLAGSYTIPNRVRHIGDYAFCYCRSLTNLTIGSSVADIGYEAFNYCSRLTVLFGMGSAPSVSSMAFAESYPTIYYLPGTTGWDAFAQITGLSAVRWNPQVQTGNTNFGVQTSEFGFNVNWASGLTVVIEASTGLVNPTWSPVATNTLDTNGTSYFSDPQWTNYTTRFYRVHLP